ncbi:MULTISPECIES: DUF2169 domain-containing protein [Methylobacterium]|uniref:DUF2169 family type VI secretion system accessory protein n=1 Tax=Methylobacterium TaxID=407 RepID=UPI00272DFFF8|nr:DUF2169 domain-containing protein [Methylobacterium sp.]
MLIRNETPFAAMGFGQLHRDGTPMAVLCVRAGCGLDPDGSLHLAEDQAIVLNDVYEGDPLRTPLLRVGDLIPYKPAADVTLLGAAHAPNGRATRRWEVALAIGDHGVRLRVHGPRSWEPALAFLTPTWKLGTAELVTRVPLDYRYALGGRYVGDPDGGADARNLLGPGLLHREFSRVGKPCRAPQIDSARAPVDAPFARPLPQGFGPVPPFWSWRQAHAGTYDEAWQAAPERRLPDDFDYRFYQTAHGDLVLPHIRGDEELRLDGLVPGGGMLRVTLPGLAIVAHHHWLDGRQVHARLTLDGVHLDLRRDEGPWRVDLTWRGWVEACPAYDGAVLLPVRLADADADGMPVSGEHGLREPEVIA